MAMAAQRSWHPAFRPNSMADLIESVNTENAEWTSQPSASHSRLEENFMEKSPITQPLEHHGLSLGNAWEDHEVKPQSESRTLPYHDIDSTDPQAGPESSTEIPTRDEYSPEIAHEGEKTDYPSEAQTPNKHSSTMSFARTVSDDVTWGEEEDEVDASWNAQSR